MMTAASLPWLFCLVFLAIEIDGFLPQSHGAIVNQKSSLPRFSTWQPTPQTWNGPIDFPFNKNNDPPPVAQQQPSYPLRSSPKRLAESVFKHVQFRKGATVCATSSDTATSVTTSTFSLIKAMVGSGMLALPAGLATATNHPSGVWPATALMIFLGILSGYTFLLYGRLTHATQAKSLGGIWKQVQILSANNERATDTQSDEPSSFIVSMASLIYCSGVCLSFSLIIGDTFSSLLKALPIASSLPTWMLSRQVSLLTATAAFVVPLCNLSSLAALAPVSLVGVLGTILSIAFLAFRCPAVVSSSPYAVAGAGMLASSVTAQPSFATYSRLHSLSPLILTAMSCVALMAHFSAPDFYHALAGKKRSTYINKQSCPTVINRFSKMTVAGYVSVILINSLALALGFLTFGGNCNGIILNNYSTQDWGANVSRFLVGVSVIGSYPFLMKACQMATSEIFTSDKETKRGAQLRTRVILLSIITAISLVIKDVGFVVSFNGALMGSSLIYTFPAFLFLKLSKFRIRTKLLTFERGFCRFLIGFGVLASIVGGLASILSAFFPHLLV